MTGLSALAFFTTFAYVMRQILLVMFQDPEPEKLEVPPQMLTDTFYAARDVIQHARSGHSGAGAPDSDTTRARPRYDHCRALKSLITTLEYLCLLQDVLCIDKLWCKCPRRFREVSKCGSPIIAELAEVSILYIDLMDRTIMLCTQYVVKFLRDHCWSRLNNWPAGSQIRRSAFSVSECWLNGPQLPYKFPGF